MTTRTRAALGALGEQAAVDYLIGQGWSILARNWRCRYGELDVVAHHPAARAVVFIEVKTRTGDGFGGLAYAVPPEKVRRLRRLAGVWLVGQPYRWEAVRLDVIRVRIGPGNGVQITHLQGVG
ncbi:hypothetical protein AWC02_20225 [Mycolicibacter engbaekii]|uniref:UPF0102 protein AWC02_20225 n=1 Tax=Mycolicibacter engbaekii TaxID=188915 RepID=A0A1X1T5B6_9MYCO|nr:YraN family protein [Mycolicibacter engbaekii]ORV39699.1 hypothetical protein AWC02_20225 [Mycolicibacter engbaekii]